MEDERVAAFARLVHDWIDSVSEPQIRARERGQLPDPGVADEGKTRTDEMRGILTDLRRHALDEANAREQAAFDSASASQRATRTVLLLAIIIALGSGIWIARDIAGTTAHLEQALAATGRLESMPMLPTSRRDELGSVAYSLSKMNALLLEKDGSLRATLADRERALAELTRANADLALRDARARAYAEFVRELQALDVGALATGGLQTLVRMADAQVAAVYLLDDADRLVPVQATASDGRAIEHRVFGAEGLPKSVMDRREPVFLHGEALGAPLPMLDLGLGSAALRWTLAYPVALGNEGAGAIVLAGVRAPSEDADRLRPRRRAAARGRAPQRVDPRPAARQERGARRTGRAPGAGQPGQDGVPGVDEPRAADAAERDPRLRGLARRRRRRSTSRRGRASRSSGSSATASTFWDSSTTSSIWPRQRPGGSTCASRRSTCASWRAPASPRSTACDAARTSASRSIAASRRTAPCDVSTDAQRVRQILLNLLSNAIKFTDQGEVVLSVRETRERGPPGGATTPGSASRRTRSGSSSRTFTSSKRAMGAATTGPASGLALSRRLARALGGDIEVRSREGQGTMFTLVLPRIVTARALAASDAGALS